jgi:predicted Zn-ribbon and HTH transcriptional regulator
MPSADKPPPERRATWRDELYRLLGEGPQTIRELSILIGAPQKELLDHLAHLERSLAHTPERLQVDPAYCLACRFEFEQRKRLAKPGRCPECKSTRIALPRFSIVARSASEGRP